jgi:exopolyphosphatase/guanosine-5'-triphosphate,3'-diphosphate pyrophosphatase
VVAAAGEARRVASANGVDEFLVFATSAVREAANCEEVTAAIEAAAGTPVTLLSGEDEARLTFLAARRWYGWSAGPMMIADIGGGSLEIGYGNGEMPKIAVSLSLGAGQLTREYLRTGPPVPGKDVTKLRRHVRSELEEATAELREQPVAVTTVATSKTFSQLARLCGAPKRKAGIHAARTLDRGSGWPRPARPRSADTWFRLMQQMLCFEKQPCDAPGCARDRHRGRSEGKWTG